MEVRSLAITRMTGKWHQRYPHLSCAITPVAQMVAKLRDDPTLELEGRLGTIDSSSGRFVAGVSRAQIDRIIEMMQNSSHVHSDDEWVEEQDFFFRVENTHCRTRVRYDSQEMSLKTNTIEKTVIATHDIAIVPHDEGRERVDMRISLKQERPVFQLQSCVNTSLVRIKQRRRFTTLDNTWAFDFSMLWSGATKTEAESRQASLDPLFEVECELIDVERSISVNGDDNKIATSLLLKMCDLLPTPSTECSVSLVA